MSLKTTSTPHRDTLNREFQHIDLLYPANNTSSSTYFDTNNVDQVTKDITLRDWKTLIKYGRNATTYLSGIKSELHERPGLYSVTMRYNVPDGNGKKTTLTNVVRGSIVDIPCPSDPNDISSSEADTKAKEAFVKSARRALTSFQGLTYLAEAREAIHMLRAGAFGIAAHSNDYLNGIRNFIKGRPGGRRILPTSSDFGRLERHTRQQYLQYTYGISPLIGDIRTAAGVLAEINTKPPLDFKMVYGEGTSKSMVDSTIQNYFTTVPELYIDYNYTTASQVRVIYRGVVNCTLDNLSAVNTKLGLDWSNVLPTIWEIIPYSFVVDYIANIGSMIDAVSFPRSSLNWVSKTVVLERRRALALWAPHPFYPHSVHPTLDLVDWASIKPSITWIVKRVSRDTYGGSLIPDFRFHMLTSKDQRKWVNITALAGNVSSLRSLVTSIFSKKK